ncbi:GntR family transcriptional regulator [Roseibium marinum]|uniref:DNA-binding GntR family transcriptional regulator n=1 Tax=Roseibium marinum TaxID=281252 RepID=A0A2S3V357_9HYPH|nr:GntR family transcriptional regulator [Roseibium marinum]POF34099.1 DNA-binding GntR family transcriptional regulator [Roseibium marinum]
MVVSSLSEALVKASDELSGPSPQGSAAGRVYTGLRARIISLDLLPDTVLSRADIGKEHGVSQSPVREAIQKLEQEGLVVSYPQSKTLVTKINVDHARETQFLRLSVELEVAKTLAERRDPELLLSSSRLLRMQKMAGEDRDISEFTTLDRLFHMSLFQAAGVSSLWHLIAGRSGHIDRLRRLNLPDPGKISAVLDAHERILAAITVGDLARVEACMREHLSGTLASIPMIMASHPQYFGEAELSAQA